jgi:hypothetical protein
LIEQNRYPDMTAQVESLFAFIEQTIETELVEDLSFIASDDRDRDLDLFIRLCLQNNGSLSQAKRDSTFMALRDDEVERLERCVADGYRVLPPLK